MAKFHLEKLIGMKILTVGYGKWNFRHGIERAHVLSKIDFTAFKLSLFYANEAFLYVHYTAKCERFPCLAWNEQILTHWSHFLC